MTGLPGLPGLLGLYPSEPITLSLAPQTLPNPEASPGPALATTEARAAGRRQTVPKAGSESQLATAECSGNSASSSAASEPPTRPTHVSGGRRRAAPPEGEALDLRLAWLRDSMLVSAQTRWSPEGRQRQRAARSAPASHELLSAFSEAQQQTPSAAAVSATRAPSDVLDEVQIGTSTVSGSRLVFDVRAVCPDLFLCIRGMQVDVDRGWLKGHGVCSANRGRAAAARTLAEGLPCVVCVRDSVETAEAPLPQLSSMVHALHLEVSHLYHNRT